MCGGRGRGGKESCGFIGGVVRAVGGGGFDRVLVVSSKSCWRTGEFGRILVVGGKCCWNSGAGAGGWWW